MVFVLLLIVHVLVCVVLIMVVLLQSGKAADLAGAFGGGGSQTALGSRGAATFLTKATSTCAILFMLTSLGLALLGTRQGGSVFETTPPSPTPGPAVPGGGAAAPAPSPQDEGKVKGAGPAGQAAPPAGGAGTQEPAKAPDKPK